MIHTGNKQSGFTAVELLITLFVAAAFLIAGYQLFNVVIRDGGQTRSESRAANVAYDHMRQYAATSTTIPCTESMPLENATVKVDGLTDVTITITISCLPDAINSLSKVEATIAYNNPQQIVKYATYTNTAAPTGASTDVTNGLVAWWKLNGDTNNSIGSPNGVGTDVTSTVNQAGEPDRAYSFNGGSSIIDTASNFGLTTKNSTISCWIYSPTSTNFGYYVTVGTTSGFGIGIGNTAPTNAGNKLLVMYNGVGTIVTTSVVTVGWHHVAFVLSPSGAPSTYLDGVLATATYSMTPTNPAASDASTNIGNRADAASNTITGSIDDVRLYSRALSSAEVLTLYAGGAQ